LLIAKQSVAQELALPPRSLQQLTQEPWFLLTSGSVHCSLPGKRLELVPEVAPVHGQAGASIWAAATAPLAHFLVGRRVVVRSHEGHDLGQLPLARGRPRVPQGHPGLCQGIDGGLDLHGPAALSSLASMTAKSPTLIRAACPSFAGACPAAKAARDTADAKASTSNFLCILMDALLERGKDEDNTVSQRHLRHPAGRQIFSSFLLRLPVSGLSCKYA